MRIEASGRAGARRGAATGVRRGGMSRWAALVARRPLAVLLAGAALTLALLAGLVDLGSGALRLRLDPSTESLMPAEGPERELYERTRRLFGSSESLVLALAAEDVFEPAVLERVVAVTRRLEAIPEVREVRSLATAQSIRSERGDLVVAPLLEEIPRSPEALERLRRDVAANPLYAGRLVSEDASATALVVSLDDVSDRALVEDRVVERIVGAAREAAGALSVWVAGPPHQKSFTGRQLTSEMRVMLPLILLLVALVLAVAIRSVRGVFLPLLAIVLGLLWTLGALAALGRELNLVTVSVPALILTVGFTYALHVVSEYYAELRLADEPLGRREAVRRTLGEVALPVLVTGITTGAGFLALALNPVPAVRQFGLFSLLGVAFTLLAALTVVPAVLALLPVSRRRDAPARTGSFDRAADALAHSVCAHRRTTIAAGVVVLAVAVAGMTQIRVAIEFPGNLDPSHPVRADWEAINQRLGGASPLRIVVEAPEPQGLLEPEALRAIRELQEWLEAQPEVGVTASIADYLMLLNRALHGDDPEHFTVPDRKRLASQLLLFGASPQTASMIDAPRQRTSIAVNATVGDSDRITALVDRIRERVETLPGGLSGSVTGSGALLYRVQDDVSRGQLVSLCAAFALIYAVLALMFTSLRVGLLALFPNVLPIAVYFGTLGYSGVTLNPSTSLVGCLALGIAVDDTIHYFARFNAEAKRSASELEGARRALRALIRPVTFTTLGLCLGFLVLTGSELGSQVEFGLLSAFTIAVAWGVDLTLSPALCSGVRIVTLWDVLRLDLGPQPQREIPLFEGLRPRQARVFALLSDIVRLPRGSRIFTEGEEGDDMFVVVSGSLTAWVDREGRRIELAAMGRGDVAGETGYFGGKRTANVEVSEDAMLIRFDSTDLEALRRRSPRAAALVYRNLNRVQAERVERSTGRIR